MALEALGAAVLWGASPLGAEEFSWKEAQSGSYADKSRWLMNQGGIGVQAPRAPGPEDTAIMKDGVYVVSVDGQSTGGLFAASDNTFIVTGSFTVGNLVGSPMVGGSGTMAVGDWALSPSAVDHPNAVIDGAQVTAGTFRMPGSNLGVDIVNGGQLQCVTYVHGGGFGAKPVSVRGFGSNFLVTNDITLAPQLEIRVSQGASATLAGVIGPPGSTTMPEFYIDGATSQLSTAALTTNKFMLTNGADATSSGDVVLSGFNNEISSGSGWNIAGKLTVRGIVGRVLGIMGNGGVFANEVEADNNAEVVLDGGSGPAVLVIKGKLTKKAATFRATNGIIQCESADLLPGEAGLGQVPVDMTTSAIAATGTINLDTWARFQGKSEMSAMAAGSCVIGTLANRQGRLEVLSGADLAVDSLVVGDAGRGTLVVRGTQPSESLSPIIACQSDSTGQVSFLDGARVSAEAVWVVGKRGTGTLTLGGASTIQMIDDNATLIVGGDTGSEGTLLVEGDSEITHSFINEADLPDLAINATLIVGDKGKGTLNLRDGSISLGTLSVGRSFEDNSVSVAPGPLQAELNLFDLIIGDGGRGRMKAEAHSTVSATSLIVGSRSGIESTLSIDRGARVHCPGAVTVGDEGRGSVICSGELTSDRELRVAASAGSVGYLEASGTGAEVSATGGKIVLGGGEAASATAVISVGGTLFAAEMSLPPPPGGASTLTTSGTNSKLYIFDRMEIGRLHRSSGPATCTVSGGATGYVGRVLLVGPTGVLNIAGGSMLVSPVSGSPVNTGVLRVEAGAHLGLAGTLIGSEEIGPGASFSPGASPGTAEIQGSLNLEAGSRLDLEIGGSDPGTGYDVVKTTGTLGVHGTVRIVFINGFAPVAGQAFQLVRSGGALTWSPSVVTVSGLAPGFSYTLTPNAAGIVTLTATSAGTGASQPILGIGQSGGAIELSWPAVSGWILEQSGPGALSGWTPVSPLPAPEAGYYFLSRPLAAPSPGSQFFRLKKL